jgi:ABC-2 type transport system ATP-binding protein
MLIAEGLHKRYGATAALDGFELTVPAGEVVGLIGHNGAGKTTFVEVTAGLTRPDRGRVLVAGADVGRSPGAARARLGLAPQQLALYPGATVRQNLRLFGGLAGLRRRALRTAIDEVAAATHLGEVLDRPVAVLSGGQQRRAQTASALLHRPAVLLLDEPTVGADPDTRAALLAVVRDRAAAGTAVCYTTHYLPELDDLGATIAVAAAGRVIARGTRAELLASLPGELRLRFAGPVPPHLAAPEATVTGTVTGTEPNELRISSTDPTALLARLVRDLDTSRGDPPVVSADVRRPSLDDLYRALREREAEHAAA